MLGQALSIEAPPGTHRTQGIQCQRPMPNPTKGPIPQRVGCFDSIQGKYTIFVVSAHHKFKIIAPNFSWKLGCTDLYFPLFSPHSQHTVLCVYQPAAITHPPSNDTSIKANANTINNLPIDSLVAVDPSMFHSSRLIHTPTGS